MFRSHEEKKMFQYVTGEVEDMIDYALPWRREGQDAIKGYMATAARAHAGRKSRSNYLAPIVHSAIYARNAVEAAQGPQVEIKFRKAKNKPRAKWINASLKASEMGHSNLRPPADGLFFEQTFDKNLLGVGAMYTDYWFQTGVCPVYDPIKHKWIEKTVVMHDDIYEQVVDPFNFGVDRGTKLGCIGCKKQYMDVFFSRDAFFNRFNGPTYMNMDPHIIPDGDWYHGDLDIRHKPRVGQGEVRARYFWDIENKITYMLANGIPIRWTYILNYGNSDNPKPHCPITTIHNDYNYEEAGGAHSFTTQNNRFYVPETSIKTTKSFWSKGDARLVKPMVAVKNTFGRVAVDYLKAAGVHFVVGPTGVVDRINRGKLYGIEPIQIDGNQNFDVKSIAAGSNFFSEYKLGEEHYDQVMSFALGRDWRRVGMEGKEERATIAQIREGRERRRDAQNSALNQTNGIWLRYWIKYQLIQQYYVEPSKMKINDNMEVEEMEEQNIERDSEGRPVKVIMRKEIPIGFEVLEAKLPSGRKVINADGEETDEMKYQMIDPTTPEGERLITEQNISPQELFTAGKENLTVIDEEPVIDIIPLSTFEQNKALNDAALIEKIQTLMPFLTMLYNGEPIIPKEGAVYFIRHITNTLDPNLNAERFLGREEGGEPRDDESAPPAFLNTKTASPSQGLGGIIPEGGAPAPAVSQGAQIGTPSSPGRAVNQQSSLINSITP
tara:strand:+ start:783 stop:2945 length:2163 start_codon:yes stop_codon:yes gene_type:complete